MPPIRSRLIKTCLPVFVLALFGCTAQPSVAPPPAPARQPETARPVAGEAEPRRSFEVTATAYNSAGSRTTSTGKRLEHGHRVIAVSADLLNGGLPYGSEVRIEGLPDTYTVADVMPSRWRRRMRRRFGPWCGCSSMRRLRP